MTHKQEAERIGEQIKTLGGQYADHYHKTFWHIGPSSLPYVQFCEAVDSLVALAAPTQVQGATWRPEVVAFAGAMERKLKANDWKGGWKDDASGALMERVHDEMREFVAAHLAYPRDTDAYRQNLLDEGADVANMVMMVVDVCNALPRATGAADGGCTRSHPHESMSASCQIKAVIAEMESMAARGSEATEHCLGEFARQLRQALGKWADGGMAGAVVSDWTRLTAPGQIRSGDELRIKWRDTTIEARAAEVVMPGSDREEVVYNRKKNHYFIVSMVLAGTESHKEVMFKPKYPRPIVTPPSSTPPLSAQPAHNEFERGFLAGRAVEREERSIADAVAALGDGAQPAQEAQGEVVGSICGHGHVFPRADGVRARCGGPALCKLCALDKARTTEPGSGA